MASLGNPRSWVPYMNSKDCSEGFCSLSCPQWCYVVYPPPPPPIEFPADEDSSSPNFSPLVIAIIGVVASAFLLVSYYTLISKYCGGRRESSPSEIHQQDSSALNDDNNHDPSFHEPWHHAANAGLDEALVKSITCFKYKPGEGEGLVGAADCSVCLGEFQDGEGVRLLPKCSHAFHVACIDTWLKSHSNCPLCRAPIFTFGAAAAAAAAAATCPRVTPPSVTPPANNSDHSQNDGDGDGDGARDVELDHVVEQVPKASALRALSDLGNLRGRHSVIEIRDDDESITRSVSMDHSFQIGDVLLHMNQDQGGTSKRSRGEESSSTSNNKFSYTTRVLHCVLSPIAMKRSFSSGRFSFSRNGGRGFSLYEN